MSKVYIVLVVVFIMTAGFSFFKKDSTSQAATGIPIITPNNLLARINAGDKLVLVDVREPEEYAQGHIPGTVLIPVGSIGSRLSELNRDDEIVVICRSGSRSSSAAAILVKNGFDKVLNMTGGMLSWEGPVER